MLVVHLVEEVEGIMILVGVKASKEYLKALEQLEVVEIKKLRNSYADEFRLMTGKDILLED
jgi:hypothetical protein